MPRRRPPVEIFTFPVPDHLSGAAARCPACSGMSSPYGCVGDMMVFKCTECSVRFKVRPVRPVTIAVSAISRATGSTAH